MTYHSYKGLTQPLQTDRANPCPGKHRVLGATTAAVRYPAAARTKTSSISVQLFTQRIQKGYCITNVNAH